MRIRFLAIAFATLSVLTFFGSSGASAQGTPLFAVLLGGNECAAGTPPTVCRAGDLDGHGGATVVLVPGDVPQVCFGIAVTGIGTISAAHIHLGQAGINGAILITLSPASAVSGNPAGWGGCTAVGVTAARIAQIRANPSNYYVNVHTSGVVGFPAGALRGQLF